VREPVEALTCELPLCAASLMAPRSQLSMVAAQAGWTSSFCPTHSRFQGGPWRVSVIARQEQIARTATAALTEVGGRMAAPPERQPGGLWRASVTCHGMELAERLARLAFGAGAAAACSPGEYGSTA
jgi:hypothetical protein